MDMFQSVYSCVQVVPFILFHSCLFKIFMNFHLFPYIPFMSICLPPDATDTITLSSPWEGINDSGRCRKYIRSL